MGRRWPSLALLLLAAGACANPPRFVKRTRVLRLLYRPATVPYLEDPRFSFEVPRKWLGPQTAPGSVRFLSPEGRASVTVSFFAPGDRGYLRPDAFRQRMREEGLVGDSHLLYGLEVSSRPAVGVRFSSVEYSPERLLGESAEVVETELVLVVEPHGNCVLRYEAPRGEFERRRKAFELLLKTLVLAAPPKGG